MTNQFDSNERFLPNDDYVNVKPHGTTGHVLEAKRLKPEYALDLQRALSGGTEHIAGYFEWAESAKSWNTKRCLFWIQQITSQGLPNEHFAFYLGKDLVGIGSLSAHGNPRSVQMAYWVGQNYIGQGIGKAMAKTMENLAIKHRPYQFIYIDHDSSNRSSGSIPQKLGYTLVGTFDAKITAKNESGFWYSWVKESPRYADCMNERLKDLRFVDLWCQMMLEMHPKIYSDMYEEDHREALKEYALELKKVRTINLDDAS